MDLDLADTAGRAGEVLVRLVIAGVVLGAVVGVGRLGRPGVRHLLDRRQRPSYTRVFTGLYRLVVAVIGALVALTVAFPSLRVADVLGIFGIVSVAAGFAFKDTFENLLAGALLMARDPFQSGDQVELGEFSGTVVGVTARETLLRGHDGRRYFVPNSQVMTGVITVATHDPRTRQELRLRFDVSVDIDHVRRLLTGSVSETPGVHPDPAPDAVVSDVVDGDVEVVCRFWTGSRRAEATEVRDGVVTSILQALQRDGVRLAAGELDVRLRSVADSDGT